MSGKDFEYANSAKNDWRDRQWREIAARLPVKPHKALCLYLAAKTDLDSGHAFRHGFIGENLIAVDSDAEVVAQLRANGRLAIQGDIRHVLLAWPDDQPLRAVVLDFCNGLTDANLQLVGTALGQTKGLEGAVIAGNFLRGRDASAARSDVFGFVNRFMPNREYDPKHRGVQFFAWSMFSVFVHVRHSWPDRFVAAMAKYTRWERATPFFNSYKSGYQTFDSVVLRNPAEIRQLVGVEYAGREACLPLYRADIPEIDTVKRRIAAALAHRTRRMNVRFA